MQKQSLFVYKKVSFKNDYCSCQQYNDLCDKMINNHENVIQ